MYTFFAVCKSIVHLDSLFTEDKLLPPKRSTPLPFMLAVLDKASPKSLVQVPTRPVKVPQWPELSLKSMWPRVCKDPAVANYFPDYLENELPPRDYFW